MDPNLPFEAVLAQPHQRDNATATKAYQRFASPLLAPLPKQFDPRISQCTDPDDIAQSTADGSSTASRSRPKPSC